MKKICELFPHIYTEGFYLHLQFLRQICIQCVSLYMMQNCSDIAAKMHCIVCVMSLKLHQWQLCVLVHWPQICYNCSHFHGVSTSFGSTCGYATTINPEGHSDGCCWPCHCVGAAASGLYTFCGLCQLCHQSELSLFFTVEPSTSFSMLVFYFTSLAKWPTPKYVIMLWCCP